jgi:hypothetical protein
LKGDSECFVEVVGTCLEICSHSAIAAEKGIEAPIRVVARKAEVDFKN